ncbi:MAG: zinc-binding dehydrogenase [Anaerolineae bacterium]|nr:zinc-binding dehydrogenase [Anaerolineae bacterium]
MKALVKFAPGKGHVEIREVPEPTAGQGQVKVEVRAAGVCGSDLHIYHDQIAIPIEPPVVMGHEFAGVVAEVGEGVDRLRPGHRVTCETTAWSCGRCLQCRLGHYNMCAERKVVGYAVDGCFARACVVNEHQVHLLPENVDFQAGALTEPLACAVHAVLELTSILAGDRVMITGPGPVGLLCLQLVKAAGGFALVCGTSQDAERLALARRFGADLTVNVDRKDTLEIVRDLTGGQGADIFLECAGAPQAARLGLEATRRGGQYTQVGLFPGPFELKFDLIAYKELRVTGSLGQRWTSWQRALSLMARGQVDTGTLVSHLMPLTEWREAFRLAEEGEGLKVVLKPVD